MAREVLTSSAIEEIFKATSHLTKFPSKSMWIDYDEEADVLYISFDNPQNATDSEMLDNGILLRYKGDKLIGITILDASER